MRGLLAGFLLLLMVAAPVAAQVPAPWEPLGGVEEGGPAPSDVAPLVDGSLLLLRDQSVLRRSPSGVWTEVLRGGRGSYLAASPGYRPLALAALGSTMHVSLDGGLSWSSTTLPPSPARLELSPTFELDGEALYVGDGRLFRTLDGGDSWGELVLVAGQRAQRVLYSPGYERDRTLVAAVVSGPFPRLMMDTAAESPGDELATIAGLLISRDGGDTWSAAGSGPSIDGVPFRHVYTLALSPAFAFDRTIYAYAWGPRPSGTFMGGGPARQWQGALFRSRDEGASWEVLQSSGPPSFQRGYPSLALSPALPLDDTLFLALSTSGASPASSGCQLLRSTDAGRSWAELVARGSYEGCLGVIPSPRFADDRVVLFGKMGWLVSQNAGLSWDSLGPTGAAAAAPVVADDLWLYVAGRDGAWRRPPFPDRVDLPSCPVVPAGGFGRLWRANDPLRSDLDCPVESEQHLSVRLRDTAGGRYLQPDLEQPAIYLLEPDGTARSVTPQEAPADGWQEAELVRQRYAGGVLLWEPGPRATITAVDAVAGRWRVFLDAS